MLFFFYVFPDFSVCLEWKYWFKPPLKCQCSWINSSHIIDETRWIYLYRRFYTTPTNSTRLHKNKVSKYYIYKIQHKFTNQKDHIFNLKWPKMKTSVINRWVHCKLNWKLGRKIMFLKQNTVMKNLSSCGRKLRELDPWWLTAPRADGEFIF